MSTICKYDYGDFKCYKKRAPNKRYCDMHSCRIIGCQNTYFCHIHRCKVKDCFGTRFKYKQYCASHACKVIGCNDILPCPKHSCNYSYTCSKLSVKDGKYCAKHSCGINGCKNAVECCDLHTCIEFNCFNTVESPWKRCLQCLTYGDVFARTDYAKIIPRDIIGIINKYLL